MKKIIVILAIVALWSGVGWAQIGMPPIEIICFDNLENFNEVPCPPPNPRIATITSAIRYFMAYLLYKFAS